LVSFIGLPQVIRVAARIDGVLQRQLFRIKRTA